MSLILSPRVKHLSFMSTFDYDHILDYFMFKFLVNLKCCHMAFIHCLRSVQNPIHVLLFGITKIMNQEAPPNVLYEKKMEMYTLRRRTRICTNSNTIAPSP